MSKEDTPERIYLTPTPVRIWHWINALGIVTLILSGIQIRFPEYANIFGHYRAAIIIHDTAGLTVSAAYLLWLAYYLSFGRSLIRRYIPRRDDIKSGLLKQARFYFHDYFLGYPNPHIPSVENKFNAIQKATYFLLMFFLLPLNIVSGLLLMNVAPLREWIILVGGIKFIAEIHYLLAASFVSFLFVHIYMASLGPTVLAHFRQMWTGWEKHPVNDKQLQ